MKGQALMPRGDKVAEALMFARAPPRPGVAPAPPVSEEIRPWWKRPENIGLVVSCLLHCLLCATLALCIWRTAARSDESDVIQALLEQPGDRDAEFESAATEPGSDSRRSAEAPMIAASALTLGNLVDPEVPPPELPPPAGTGSAHGIGRGGSGGGMGTGGRKPPGKNAVTEGSFTVWTVPDDPLPGENYLILIEVRLPEKVHRYPRSDISGLVTGTDGWRQPLPGNATPLQPYLPVEDHTVRLQVEVPGAGRRVEDVVKVRSRLLKEEQVLKLVF